MNAQQRQSPLDKLQGLALNGYRLHLGEVKPLRLSSWTGFKLYLQSPEQLLSLSPVIKGIYSAGAKDGVKPWLDVEYWEELEFHGQSESGKKLSLSREQYDRALFRHLSGLVPAGGHLMVSYEGNERIHVETRRALSLRVPAAATPLGYLIFQAGFQYIKDWYLSEGGFEGPRKLWGEKAPDRKWMKTFYEKTARQMQKLMAKKFEPGHEEIIRPALQKARDILEAIKKDSAH